MGTNYYFKENDDTEPLHIGKSSYGWHFALHVYPELEINTLKDWLEILHESSGAIYDEYGEPHSVEQLERIILNRYKDYRTKFPSMYYGSEEQFHTCNHSEPGLNNLYRARADGILCVGHGEGTYDYFVGEFS